LDPGLHTSGHWGDDIATEGGPPEGGEDEAPAEEGTAEGSVPGGLTTGWEGRSKMFRPVFLIGASN